MLLSVTSSDVHIFELYFLIFLQENVDTVTVERVESVGEEDCRTGVSLLSRERFFIYLINKYISLSDICLTVHH